MSELNTEVRCRKCRNIIHVGKTVTQGDNDCDLDISRLLYLDEAGLPDWVGRAVEQAHWTRSKLTCPRCSGRLGAFDFLRTRMCLCGHHSLPPVHLQRNRLDIVPSLGVSLPLPVSVPLTQRPLPVGQEVEKQLTVVIDNSQQGHDLSLGLTDNNGTVMSTQQAVLPRHHDASSRSDKHLGDSDYIAGCKSFSHTDDYDDEIESSIDSHSGRRPTRHSRRNSPDYCLNAISSMDSENTDACRTLINNGNTNTTACNSYDNSLSKTVDLGSSEAGVDSMINNQDSPGASFLSDRDISDEKTSRTTLRRRNRRQWKRVEEERYPNVSQNGLNFVDNDEQTFEVDLARLARLDSLPSARDNVSEEEKNLPRARPKNIKAEIFRNKYIVLRKQARRETNRLKKEKKCLQEQQEQEEEERLTAEDTCPICLDVFYKPQIVHPCRHVFCELCLRQLANGKLRFTQCPLCRDVICKCVTDDKMDQALRDTYPLLYKARQLQEKTARKSSLPLPQASYHAPNWYTHGNVSNSTAFNVGFANYIRYSASWIVKPVCYFACFSFGYLVLTSLLLPVVADMSK